MKNSKKILAMILMLSMVFSFAMSATAFAAPGDPGSVMVIGAIEDQVYDIYRILDVTMTPKSAGAIYPDVDLTYSINSKWAGFFADGAPGAAYLTDTNPGELYEVATGKFLNISDSTVAEFSDAARKWAVETPVANDGSKAADATGFVEFTELPLGYYLVNPRGATELLDGYACIASLNTSTPEARVNVKGKVPDGTKEVDDPSLDVGQYANFKVTYTVPDDIAGNDVYNWVMKDTMTAGLTCKVDDLDLVVEIGDPAVAVVPATNYQVVAEGSNGFKVTVNMKPYAAMAGQALVFKYHAKINENAIVTKTLNEVESEYGNDPNAYPHKIPPVDVEVWTNKIVIDKFVGDRNNPTAAPTDASVRLNGAEFILIKKVDNGAGGTKDQFYKFTPAQAAVGTTPAVDATVTWVDNLSDATVVTTANNGTKDGYGEFGGIEDGTYYLREIKAPSGYNIVDRDLEVEVAGVEGADGKTVGVSVTKEVANFSGPGLPSTGGVGTTLFYIIGSMLLLGAVVLLVTRKRMGHEA